LTDQTMEIQEVFKTPPEMVAAEIPEVEW